MFIHNNVHSSWEDFLTTEIIEEIDLIESKVGKELNPTKPEMVLRFLSVDLNKIKIIWLGQDVYPSKGVATGRAFEVGDLASWNEPFRQSSLKNIVRLIHKEYNNINEYRDIKKYSEIKEEIVRGTFKMKSPANWFQSLEDQGVLFLNTSFTCKIGEPNSHKDLWEPFSKKVLEFISSKKPDAIWFLWGKEAKSNKVHLTNGSIYESRHPSRVSESYQDDFLRFEGFRKTMDEVNWLG
ncbi:uracil-DNA glycosylase [Halalkalibacter akibai]|uniref:Uracil-DNA glycosylase n=1 Tax=Halalkalibacter akibai (strain ATCC 43226 / DSM 21942 / CIP 109018 / JCM 9157 / 1139) TaxID=1236973 RepID=W4QN89_HALA3|nr:uracil-DNA glycosylase [Halalkalibacter akibai]GAE33570.1 uracil-DNA glycosylase [Halalkalibacter akibai JCM 9157]